MGEYRVEDMTWKLFIKLLPNVHLRYDPPLSTCSNRHIKYPIASCYITTLHPRKSVCSVFALRLIYISCLIKVRGSYPFFSYKLNSPPMESLQEESGETGRFQRDTQHRRVNRRVRGGEICRQFLWVLRC